MIRLYRLSHTEKKYSHHALRSSHATALFSEGVNRLGIKRSGGWKSDRAVEGYIRSSTKEQVKLSRALQGVDVDSATGSSNSGSFTKVRRGDTQENPFNGLLSLNDCKNFQIHVHVGDHWKDGLTVRATDQGKAESQNDPNADNTSQE